MPLRIPPHWLGLVKGINRGIGESVVIPYETKIKKIQHKITSQINRELMPQLGFKDLKFKFNAISLTDEKVIIEKPEVTLVLTLFTARLALVHDDLPLTATVCHDCVSCSTIRSLLKKHRH